jgi:CheY-like chemotaxis protein
MDIGHRPFATKLPAKLSVLLMDSNAERRALRKRILLLRGVEVIGVTDLMEAGSIWHRDRYDLVLIDIRNDHYGCMAWRDEIKKENPKQLVAFLTGPPRFVDLEPLLDSYIAEEHGKQWGDSLRQAVKRACGSLAQRNGFAEVGYRIAVARKMRGLPPRDAGTAELADYAPQRAAYGPNDDQPSLSSTAAVPQPDFGDDAAKEMENG